MGDDCNVCKSGILRWSGGSASCELEEEMLLLVALFFRARDGSSPPRLDARELRFGLLGGC